MTNPTPSRSEPTDERIYVYGAALLLGTGAGVLVANVDLVWVAAAFLVIVAVALVASREATLWFVVVSGLILTGLSQLYVPETKYLRYLPALAAAGLLLHVTSDWLSRRENRLPATVTALLAFLLVGLISATANWSSVGMAAIGLKSYYPMWALFLGLAICRWRPSVIDSLPRAALLIALLQLPFVASQLLILVPLRESAHILGIVPVDIVAGTFGGSLYGGGANAVLSLFLITVSACLIGMWRQGALSGFLTTIAVAMFLTPVMLNGSKVAVLYLPIVFATIFHTEIFRQPLKALAALALAGALVAGMLTSFTMLDSSPKTRTWEGLITETWERQLATEEERSYLYSGLTRWTVLTFWAEQHKRLDPIELLIGHGPGATRVQPEGLDFAETLAETKYGGKQIGYTALAALLWEVGVLGLLAVLWIFWQGFRQAGRLAAHHAHGDRVKSGIAHGLRASIVILVLSLAHKDFFAFHIPFQTFVALVLGYLAAQTNALDRDAADTGRRETRSERLVP